MTPKTTAPPADELRRIARRVLDAYHGPEYMRARESDSFGASEADMRVDQMVEALTEAGLDSLAAAEGENERLVSMREAIGVVVADIRRYVERADAGRFAVCDPEKWANRLESAARGE